MGICFCDENDFKMAMQSGPRCWSSMGVDDKKLGEFMMFGWIVLQEKERIKWAD